ncbi:MAG TPA: acetyl-CoA C-acyltransferase [Thermoanaerobaculales bacterium]|nr:acetyl-CoA C-acyltransferase [Thermoanaerobaculales bacterium]HQL29020.1 acetyl-CoA C-acyltransferase [Thermoanaerobaculales bacterium]
MSQSALPQRRVVVIDGCRTPFCRSGTAFNDLTTYDLGRMAVAGLVQRTRIDPAVVDLLVMGTVIADPRTSNLGREVVLGTQLPESCPAYTVSVACVSSLQAFLDCARAISTGAAEVAIAAGAETLSDAPIRFRRPFRKRLIASQRARGPLGYAGLLKGLRLRDLLPEPVALAEFSTGELMGENCERLAKRVGISREDQDRYALTSHQRAARAAEQGLLARQIVPVRVPPAFAAVAQDNGVRGDSTLGRLASLRPAFDRRFGTVTAGNSSYLTDGAGAVLLASEEAARRLRLEPLAALKGSATAALDPLEELLLGPALTLPRALDAAGCELPEVGVLELHEAFAAQVLAVLRLLDDDGFCRERLGRDRAVGAVDRGRLNAWGGSLAVGHPFGATGARLITTCCHRMQAERARLGAVAACAAGAIGIGLVFEAM